MITASQCRAARGLLDWTQKDLAEKSRIGIVTIRQFEGGKTVPMHATMVVLKQAFEAAGVEFLAQDGVRRK